MIYRHWRDILPAVLFLHLCSSPVLQAQGPVADMHLHYKWSQREITSPSQAVRVLADQDVVLGVVIGTPAELALALRELAPEKIVPIFSPYRSGGDWYRWAYDDSVLRRARAALASGDYLGIGELHLIGGFSPGLDKAVVLQGLMRLAIEYDVPILIHTEYSRPEPMLELCQRFPQTRILWAHAGAILPPDQVARVLDTCRNVHAGLAARDPWRFVNNPVTDDDGRLLPGWRVLMLEYADRLMLGSDPVWPVDQLDRWDEPDTGWQELGRFWAYHRRWLAQLPDPVARKIACGNAVDFFRRSEDVNCNGAVGVNTSR